MNDRTEETGAKAFEMTAPCAPAVAPTGGEPGEAEEPGQAGKGRKADGPFQSMCAAILTIRRISGILLYGNSLPAGGEITAASVKEINGSRP